MSPAPRVPSVSLRTGQPTAVNSASQFFNSLWQPQEEQEILHQFSPQEAHEREEDQSRRDGYWPGEKPFNPWEKSPG